MCVSAGVYSLESVQLGVLLFRVSLGANSISVSLSPRGRHLVVGLRRMVALGADSQVRLLSALWSTLPGATLVSEKVVRS